MRFPRPQSDIKVNIYSYISISIYRNENLFKLYVCIGK